MRNYKSVFSSCLSELLNLREDVNQRVWQGWLVCHSHFLSTCFQIQFHPSHHHKCVVFSEVCRIQYVQSNPLYSFWVHCGATSICDILLMMITYMCLPSSCVYPPQPPSYTHVNPHLFIRLGSCPHPMAGDMTRLSRIRFCCTCFKTIQLSSEEQKHLTLVSCFACWFFLSETIQSSPHLQHQPLGFALIESQVIWQASAWFVLVAFAYNCPR